MALKACPSCGLKVSSKAKSCPGCGHPIAAKRYGCGTLLALVVCGLFVWSATHSVMHPESILGSPGAPHHDDLEVIESHGDFDQLGILHVKGTAKSNSDRSFSYAQVEINLYDKKGVQVGSTMANINNLTPHGTWKFEAVAAASNISTFRVMRIDGF